VVLTVGELPTAAVQDLQADGLDVRMIKQEDIVPMWEPKFVKGRQKLGGNWFQDRGLVPSFPQTAAWALTEFDRVVTLDSDLLVLQSVEELFNLGEVAFAASPETHGDQEDFNTDNPSVQRTYLINAGVMSLRPDRRVLAQLRSQTEMDGIRFGSERIGTFGVPTFQSVIDTFMLATRYRRGLVAHGWTGAFLGCGARGRTEKPHHFLNPMPEPPRFVTADDLGPHDTCLLPVDYNFFVDFPHSFSFAKSFRETVVDNESRTTLPEL